MSDLEWNSIEGELWREYRFPGGDIVRVDKPLSLAVSASGGHRVIAAGDQAHYIPKGWIHLRWQVREGVAPCWL